jgi:hypothetical protein
VLLRPTACSSVRGEYSFVAVIVLPPLPTIVDVFARVGSSRLGALA